MNFALRRPAIRPDSQAPPIRPATTGRNSHGKPCADNCSSSRTMRGAEAMYKNSPAKLTELETSSGQNSRSRPKEA